MSVRARLIRIGNSRGIRIPKPLLEQVGLGDSVRLVVERNRLVIQPDRSPRQGWEEALAAMPEHDDDRMLLGDKITNAFDRNEWAWRPASAASRVKRRSDS